MFKEINISNRWLFLKTAVIINQEEKNEIRKMAHSRY